MWQRLLLVYILFTALFSGTSYAEVSSNKVTSYPAPKVSVISKSKALSLQMTRLQTKNTLCIGSASRSRQVAAVFRADSSRQPQYKGALIAITLDSSITSPLPVVIATLREKVASLSRKASSVRLSKLLGADLGVKKILDKIIIEEPNCSESNVNNEDSPGESTPTPTPPSSQFGPGTTPTATPTPGGSITPTPTNTPTPLNLLGPSPTNLVVTSLSPTNVGLHWYRAINQSGIRLERRLTGGSFSELDYISGAMAESYTDASVQPCASYQYRIAATIAGLPGYSGYSNIVTTTVPANGTSCSPGTSPTPTPSPTTPPVSPPTGPVLIQPPRLVTSNNELSITNQETFAISDEVIEFGRLFSQGSIPNCVGVKVNGSPVVAQADVKSRWSDGSVKHALVSVLVSMAAQSTALVTFQNQSSCNNVSYVTPSQMLGSNYNFDAIMSLGFGTGVIRNISARQMIIDGALSYWKQGPLATTVILANHTGTRPYDTGPLTSANSPRPFSPQFEITFYPYKNRVKARFIGELSNPDELGDLNYSVTLLTGSVNPQTVLVANAPGSAASRWTKAFYLGSQPPQTAINHNIGWLYQLGFPKYDRNLVISPTSISNEYAAWLNSDRTLTGYGRLIPGQGSGGGKPQINLIDTRIATYLYTGNSNIKEVIDSNAELALNWPRHLREDKPVGNLGQGKVIDIRNRPTLFLKDTNYADSFTNKTEDAVRFIGPGTLVMNSAGWENEIWHTPQFHVAMYLLFGEHYCLEEAMFWAGFDAAYLAPWDDINGRGSPSTRYIPSAITMIYGARSFPWTWRNRAWLAWAMPDALTSEKQYFNELSIGALASLKGEMGFPIGQTQGANATSMYQFGSQIGSGACRAWLSSPPAPGVGDRYVNRCLHPLRYFGTGQDGGWYTTPGVNPGVGPGTTGAIVEPWMQSYAMGVFKWMDDLGYDVDDITESIAENYVVPLALPPSQFNHYLLLVARAPTHQLTLNGGVYSLNPFTSWTAWQTGFTPAAQAATSFSQFNGSATMSPDSHVSVYHSGAASAFQYMLSNNINPQMTQQAIARWRQLFVDTPGYQSSMSQVPGWAIETP